jgi:L-rhamnose mutarotase
MAIASQTHVYTRHHRTSQHRLQRVDVIAMDGCEDYGIFLSEPRGWVPDQYEYLDYQQH